jgi:hypothetical protein
MPSDGDALELSYDAASGVYRYQTQRGMDNVPSGSHTADYTLVLADRGTVVELNKATAITLTVPTNASVAFPVGTIIEVYAVGAGQVTIAAAGGVTLRAPNGAKLAQQYSTGFLRKRASDEWVLNGDTAV